MIVETRQHKGITYRKHVDKDGNIYYTKEIQIEREEYRESVRVYEKNRRFNKNK